LKLRESRAIKLTGSRKRGNASTAGESSSVHNQERRGIISRIRSKFNLKQKAPEPEPGPTNDPACSVTSLEIAPVITRATASAPVPAAKSDQETASSTDGGEKEKKGQGKAEDKSVDPRDLWQEAVNKLEPKERELLGLQESTEQEIGPATPSVLDDVIKESKKYCSKNTSEDSELSKDREKEQVVARDTVGTVLKCTLQVKSVIDVVVRFDKSGYGKQLLFSLRLWCRVYVEANAEYIGSRLSLRLKYEAKFYKFYK
jgi:hypothetical protein